MTLTGGVCSNDVYDFGIFCVAYQNTNWTPRKIQSPFGYYWRPKSGVVTIPEDFLNSQSICLLGCVGVERCISNPIVTHHGELSIFGWVKSFSPNGEPFYECLSGLYHMVGSMPWCLYPFLSVTNGAGMLLSCVKSLLPVEAQYVFYMKKNCARQSEHGWELEYADAIY